MTDQTSKRAAVHMRSSSESVILRKEGVQKGAELVRRSTTEHQGKEIKAEEVEGSVSWRPSWRPSQSPLWKGTC